MVTQEMALVIINAAFSETEGVWIIKPVGKVRDGAYSFLFV